LGKATKRKKAVNSETLGGGQDYLDLFESTRDGVYISDLAGNLQAANKSLGNMFGYTRQELLLLNVKKLYKNTKDRTRFKAEIIKQGYVIDYELQLQRKDGSSFVGVLNSTARISGQGDIIGYQGIIRDISVLKFMSAAIVDTEKRFQVLLEESPDAILVLNEMGKVIDANPAALKLFGLKWDEIIDSSFLNLMPKKHLDKSVKDFERCLKGDKTDLETFFKHKSGKVIPVEIHVRLINYGGVSAMLYHIIDVSKRKLAEKRRMKERQRSLKAIVNAQEEERKRISLELHDGLGQILTSIRIRMDTALRGKGIQHKMKLVQEVKGSIDEMIVEVRAMSNKLMPGTLSDFGLVAAINQFVEQSQAVTSTKISFHSFGLEERLGEEAEIGIYRIVQEAMNNCLKYAKASEINVHLNVVGSVLRLMIEDDGKGFNPKTIFSQSKERKGHGNGLGNMKNRSELLNGEILIESALNKGTTITVDFPMKKVSE